MGDRIVLAYPDNNIGGGRYDANRSIQDRQTINDGSYGVPDAGDMVVIGERGPQGQWLNYYGAPVDEFVMGCEKSFQKIGATIADRKKMVLAVFDERHPFIPQQVNAFVLDKKFSPVLNEAGQVEKLKHEWILGFGHVAVNQSGDLLSTVDPNIKLDSKQKQGLDYRYQRFQGSLFALKDDQNFYVKITFEVPAMGGVPSPMIIERMVRKGNQYNFPDNKKLTAKIKINLNLDWSLSRGSVLEPVISRVLWDAALGTLWFNKQDLAKDLQWSCKAI